jgi:hypothetical protein
MAKKVSPEDHTWISEKEAAGILGYEWPRSMRLNVKKSAIPVSFRTTRGRNYQYSLEDIRKYQLETSTAA